MRLVLLLYTVGCALAVNLAVPAQASEGSKGENDAAHKLYIAKCAKCHKFYDPAKYSDKEWQRWMGKMSKKAKLKPDQEEALLRYLDSTFRHPQNSPPAKTSASP